MTHTRNGGEKALYSAVACAACHAIYPEFDGDGHAGLLDVHAGEEWVK